MDYEPRRRYRNGIDWHRVTFLACLLVAILLMVLSAISKNGRVLTLFDPDGRAIARQAFYDHFPGLAKSLGIRRR